MVSGTLLSTGLRLDVGAGACLQLGSLLPLTPGAAVTAARAESTDAPHVERVLVEASSWHSKSQPHFPRKRNYFLQLPMRFSLWIWEAPPLTLWRLFLTVWGLLYFSRSALLSRKSSFIRGAGGERQQNVASKLVQCPTHVVRCTVAGTVA